MTMKGETMKRLLSFAALSGAALMLTTQDAHAYLDPGTGSMLLQGLIAGIAAGSVVIGTYWNRLKTFFRSGLSKKSDAEKQQTSKASERR